MPLHGFKTLFALKTEPGESFRSVATDIDESCITSPAERREPGRNGLRSGGGGWQGRVSEVQCVRHTVVSRLTCPRACPDAPLKTVLGSTGNGLHSCISFTLKRYLQEPNCSFIAGAESVVERTSRIGPLPASPWM